MTLPHPLQTVLKGLRNGLEYGSKIRLVHSIVMTLLFRNWSRKEFKAIFEMAVQHGSNLGLFVACYKTLTLLLQYFRTGAPTNHLFAGLVAGGVLFGKKTSINYQIVLYLFSRIFVALISLLYKHINPSGWSQSEVTAPLARRYGYLLLAGMCWGLVMWLFEVDQDTLQPSLKSSMMFLYVQSNETVSKWTELIPFWPSKKTRRIEGNGKAEQKQEDKGLSKKPENQEPLMPGLASMPSESIPGFLTYTNLRRVEHFRTE